MVFSKKLLFVINPFSGVRSKEHLPSLIEEKASEFQFEYKLYETKGNDFTELSSLVSNYNPDIVVAAGGDGTCNLVAQVIRHKEIVMAIIPLGSANGLATELNIPKSSALALDLPFKGKVLEADAVKINGNYYSLHLSDLGLNATIIHRFEKGNKRGIWGYAKQLFKELFFLRSYKFTVECDDQIIKKRAVSITLANCTKYGTGAIINPGGKIDDGKFEICILKQFPLRQLLSLTIKFFRGTIHRSVYLEILSCKKVKISCKKRVIFHVDGEIISKVNFLNAEILPNAVKIYVPA